MAFMSFHGEDGKKIALDTILKEVFMLEWSASQKCYHISLVEDLLDINCEARMSNKALDYIPIAISDDPDELKQFAGEIDKQVPRFSGGDPE